AVEDGVAIAPAGHQASTAEHSEMLAHVGHLASDSSAEVAHRELADGERLEDAQALRVGKSPTDRGIALAIDLSRYRQGVQHVVHSISVCANSQVPCNGSGLDWTGPDARIDHCRVRPRPCIALASP